MNTAIWITALALAAPPAAADAAQPAARDPTPAVPTAKDTAKRVKKTPSPQTLATAQAILEQRLPQGIRAGAPQVVGADAQDPAARNAAALIDLIQGTIAPDSWDVRGGQGVIVYFSPGNVLVVRQTGEAHNAVGNVIRQMRRN